MDLAEEEPPTRGVLAAKVSGLLSVRGVGVRGEGCSLSVEVFIHETKERTFNRLR